MDLATVTGQREGELLKRLAPDPSVYADDAILYHPGKSMRRHPRHGKIIATVKTVIVEWSPELRAAVERARMLGPDIRNTLICNLQGKPFTESGFGANWHRLIQAALKGRMARKGVAALAPVLTEAFTIHDLRARSASDDELEDAHERLAHDDPRTTQAIYRRKPRRARAGRKVT
jgi:integrase